VLSQVQSVRYLGVLNDSTLSWNFNISNMISRVRPRLASIIRFGSLPPAVFCVLNSALVMPLFDYYDVIWTPSTAKQTSMIEEFIQSLYASCHHLNIPSFLLHIAAFIRLFRLLNLYAKFSSLFI